MSADEKMISDDQIENLDKIFDKTRPLKTREEITNISQLTDSEIDDDTLYSEPVSTETMAELNEIAKRINHELLVKKHGKEKAKEILLNHELGELTYDYEIENEH